MNTVMHSDSGDIHGADDVFYLCSRFMEGWLMHHSA